MSPMLACEMVVSLCAQITLVIFMTVVIERWLGSAKLACRLWTSSFVATLGLIAAALLLPHVRWLAVPASLPDATIWSIVTWQTRVIRGAIVVWACVFVFILVRWCIRCSRLLRFLASRCRPMTSEEIATLPVAAGEVPMNVRWLVSEDVQGPFCWQLHQPTIVLPLYALSEDRTTLRHLLIHELEHLRTSHPLQHFLQGLCGSLLWFHPAAWWARRHAELVREYVCDEAAATTGGTVAAYLRTLANVAERSIHSPACTLGFGRCKSALVRRSLRLVALAEQPSEQSPTRSVVAVLALGITVIAASQLWLPVNPLASSRSRMSPWPHWTADVLHDFGIHVRDFERFDQRQGLHELIESSG